MPPVGFETTVSAGERRRPKPLTARPLGPVKRGTGRDKYEGLLWNLK